MLTSAVVVWGSRTAAPLVRMGVVVLISRWLGAQGLGAYQVLIATLTIFEMIPALGFWPLLVRNVARAPENAFRYLVHAAALSLAASLLLIGPMNLSSMGYESSIRSGMLVLSFTLAPSVLIVVSEAILISMGRPQAVALLRVGENAVLVGAVALLLQAGYGLVAIAIVMLGCRLLCAAAAVLWALLACPVRRWALEWRFARTLLAEAPVFLASSVAWALYSRLDVLVLSRLVSLEQVGYYGAALRILGMCQEIPQSAILVVLPMLSASYGSDHEAFVQVMRRTAKYFIGITLPLAVGATVLGGRVLPLLFGAGFDRAGDILTVLMWSLVPFSLMKLLGSGLIASNHQVADLVINVAVLALTMGLLAVFIPMAGALGAAWAVIGSVMSALAMRLAYFRLRIEKIGPDARTFRPALAAAALAVVLLLTRDLPLPVVFGTAAFVYPLGLLLFGAFERSEIAVLPGLRSLEARWGRARLP